MTEIVAAFSIEAVVGAKNAQGHTANGDNNVFMGELDLAELERCVENEFGNSGLSQPRTAALDAYSEE